MAGRTVGIVANNPKHAAGCLDINASIKAGLEKTRCFFIYKKTSPVVFWVF
jgi:acetyl-CoA carboxylase carboxyltransferase component